MIASRDFGEAGEGFAVIGKAVLQHRDPVGLPIPGPHQFGARLDPPGQFQASIGLGRRGLHQLIEQALGRGGKAAIGLFLNAVGNAAPQQVRTERLGRFGPK